MPAGSSKDSFILVTNDVQTGDRRVSAETIVGKLLDAGFWAFGTVSSTIREAAEGDRVLIYVAGSGRGYFVARAVIAGTARPAKPAEQLLMRSLALTSMSTSIALRDIERFQAPIPIRPLVPVLHFVRSQTHFGLNLRKALVKIEPADWEEIVARIDRSAAQ